MTRDSRRGFTSGLRIVPWTVVSLLVFSAGPSAGADPPPSTCNLDGNANEPCSIEIKLDNRVLPQALPFDVPVFLQGAAEDDVKRLVLHVFSAKQAFRVQRACDQPGTHWQDCPPDNRKFVCSLVSSGGKGKEQVKWSYSDFETGKTSEVSCLLEPRVSTWNRVGDSDDRFVLRVPPEPANRYFVFRLEIGKKPTEEQKKDVINAFLQQAAPIIAKQKLRASPDFQDWVSELRQGLCAALERVGWQEGVRFEMETESILSCPSDQESPLQTEGADRLTTLQEDQLTDLLSSVSDIIEQARTLEQVRTRLAARRADLPIIAGREPVFGLTEEDLASGDLDVTPLLRALDRDQALAAEIASANTGGWSGDELASFQEAKSAVEFLVGSARDYRAVLRPVMAEISNDVIALEGSNIGSFLTRQKSYLAADLGILYSSDVEQALPYVGTNIYLVPVNKQAPLNGVSLLKRFGFTIGVTVGEFDTDRAEPLFSSMNLLLGGGLRVTESIRVGAGTVLFREADRDPLSNAKRVVFSYYASVSFDYEVRSLFKFLDKLLPGS